ncbi:MAG: AgmX/PglI C-terminal domain-containing protein [Bdellovibrionaceae bacterium]|nr:AgmX/PglI C-terminal domain-containing protein [Pseudobdellovibrionaceae bacterium]
MTQDKYVFINSSGQIVRYISWNCEKAFIVQDKKSGRIELISSTDELGSEFELVMEVTKKQVQKEEVLIQSRLRLVFLKVEKAVIPTVLAPEEDNSRFKMILHRTALAHFVALLIVLLIGYFYDGFSEKSEVIVTVAKQNRTEKITKKLTIVKKEKIDKKVKVSKSRKKITKVAAKPIKSIKSKKVKSRGTSVSKSVDTGVLGALSGLHAGINNTSLKLGSVDGRKTKGIGTGRSGSHNRVSFGKGLVASQPGSGSEIGAIESYKTRGQGGGEGGYGKIAIGGSGKIYSAPLREEAFIDGGLDRSQIDAVVKRNIGQITYCYEKGLQKDPNLSGRVAVYFIIASSGSVSKAKIQDSSLKSKPVESCIIAKLMNWKFPKPLGQVSVQVTYPFSLRRLGVNNISQRSL